MTPARRNLADCAMDLLGAPFRFRGRNPDTGLDCIGLVALASEKAGQPLSLPAGYAMRQTDFGKTAEIASACGLIPVLGGARRGDIGILAVSPAQQHLVIHAGDGLFIHAHAGLGRVVSGPADPAWSLLSTWRLPGGLPEER